jgi:surface antigen
MRKVLMTSAAAAAMLFSAAAALAQPDYGPPPPGPDPNGYYSQYDQNGYYDRNGNYIRYRDRNNEDAGPPPDEDRYYREGQYEDNCRRNNNVAGTIFGALAGGLIGGAASHGNGGAVVGGVILGGMLGNAITRDMPCEDHPYAMRVYAEGLDGDIGERYEWHHGDDYGYFVPERQFDRDGYVCRSFSETTYAHGRTYTRSGTACRHRDGQWHFD